MSLPYNTIFMGCTHIDHEKDFIWKARGFDSAQNHAEWITREIVDYRRQNPGCHIVHLGDGFLNSTVERAEQFLAKWGGVGEPGLASAIWYLWGNHEGPTKQIFTRETPLLHANPSVFHQVYPTRWKSVAFVGDQLTVKINGQQIFCAHYPFAIWDKSHHGVWHVHSHNHGGFVESLAEHPSPKRLDVGVDQCIKLFQKPYITFPQLQDIMNWKRMVVLDHHDAKTT